MLSAIINKILSNEYGGEIDLYHYLISKLFNVKIKIFKFNMPNKTY